MRSKILYVLLGVGIQLIWLAIWRATTTIIDSSSFKVYIFFHSCIVAPLIEEFIFRVGFLRWTKNYPDFRQPMLILSSFVFGYLHGNFNNVFIQGVAGYIIGTVYIKNDYCYGSAVLFHFLLNAIFLFS